MKRKSEFLLTEIPTRGWRAVGRLTGLTEMPTKTLHTILFIILSATFFTYVCMHMGVQNMLNTFMRTAYSLLIDTVFLTMAMTTLAGAFGRLLSEFGLNNILNYIFRYLMAPLYGLPGITFLGAFSSFLSENMAIIAFSRDPEFMRHLKPHHVPLLCNLGTSFGMGLFIVTLMVGLGFYKEAIIGMAGALVGSVFSVRFMSFLIRRKAKNDFTPDTQKRLDEIIQMAEAAKAREEEEASPLLGDKVTIKETRGFVERFLSAIVEGGRYGVDIGLGMIPGVLVICSCLMILLKGEPETGFSGGAFEGVAAIPHFMENYGRTIFEPLLGMSSPEAFGLTAACLGSAAAAVAQLKTIGAAMTSHEVSVFAAFGILWSGFLATHVAIMDALGFRRFISAAVWSHAIAGFVAGITANILYQFLHASGWV